MQSLWMLAASLLFALMAACSKLGAADFGTMELVFYRSVFGTAVIGLWVLSKGFTVRTPLILSHIKRSFLGTFGLTIWFYAIAHLPLGTAMTLNYTSPLYMAAFVAFMTMRRHEGQSWGLLASVAAGFLGITLVLQPEVRGGDELPALVGLASGSSPRGRTCRSKNSPPCTSPNGASSSTSRSSGASGAPRVRC